MDETQTFPTYRLHVDFESAGGLKLHTARGVDTVDQARWIAAQGLELDERDGTRTSYRLFVWEVGLDQADLRRVVDL